jgi:flavin reductase (DIM6/NTAB) family NADH-FMN oxidoreductase RutF
VEKRKVDFPDYGKEIMEVLREGRALLVAQGKDGKPNPMTIAWGSIMYAWNRPVFVVLVRDSRYTYKLLEESESFTVNLFDKAYNKAMGFCGSKSGRDFDKFRETGLTPGESKAIVTPIIEEAFLNIECKVVMKSEMNPALVDPEIIKVHYQGDIPEKTYHTLYFGEIVDMYGDFPDTLTK